MTALPDPRQGRDDQLRVILAMGGWTDSTGTKYSDLVSSAEKRAAFVASAVTFLRRHNFRGLQLDWNYPKCWHSDCRKGPASDKPNFTLLVKVLTTSNRRLCDSKYQHRVHFDSTLEKMFWSQGHRFDVNFDGRIDVEEKLSRVAH